MLVEIIGQRTDRARGFGEFADQARQIGAAGSAAAEHMGRRLQRALRRVGGLAQAVDQRFDLRLHVARDVIEIGERAIKL